MSDEEILKRNVDITITKSHNRDVESRFRSARIGSMPIPRA